jgi:serine/threonine protein kinase
MAAVYGPMPLAMQQDASYGSVAVAENKIRSIDSVGSGDYFNEHDGPSVYALSNGLPFAYYIDFYIKNIYVPNNDRLINTTIPGYGKIKSLGSGAFGKVYKLTMDDNTEYVFKVIDSKTNPYLINFTYSEIKKLQIVKGKKWAVQLLAAQINYSNNLTFILYPYIPGIELFDMLAKYERNNSLKTNETKTKIITIFNKILDAFDELHKLGIIHNDIKPENIWIRDDNSEPILLDFGLSYNIDDTAGKSGTLLYQNPKLTHLSKATPNRNYYSLGKLASILQVNGIGNNPIVSKLLENGINSEKLGAQRFGGKRRTRFNYRRKKHSTTRKRNRRL